MPLPEAPWRRDETSHAGQPAILDADGKLICYVYQQSDHPKYSHQQTELLAEAIILIPQMVKILRSVWKELPSINPIHHEAWNVLESLGLAPVRRMS